MGAGGARRLKNEIGPGSYRTWLEKAAFVGIEDGEATISLPSKFIADYVRANYLDRLTTFWGADNPDPVDHGLRRTPAGCARPSKACSRSCHRSS